MLDLKIIKFLCDQLGLLDGQGLSDTVFSTHDEISGAYQKGGRELKHCFRNYQICF